MTAGVLVESLAVALVIAVLLPLSMCTASVGGVSNAFVGLSCYTCSDGCDHPREPGMGVLVERCDEEKDQAPLCASFFDPVNRRYSYGRGCLRITDRPSSFRESECMILDVADFWNPKGPKRKTCVCLCSFDTCNYDEICYNPGDSDTDGTSAGTESRSQPVSGALVGFVGIAARWTLTR